MFSLSLQEERFHSLNPPSAGEKARAFVILQEIVDGGLQIEVLSVATKKSKIQNKRGGKKKMIKKLSMVVLGIVMTTFIMVAVPREKGEAAKVVHEIYHYQHSSESGQSAISGGYWQRFTTKYRRATVTYSWIPTGLRIHVGIMKCGAYQRAIAFVPSRDTLTIYFNF
jgi:hypothetical protein